MTTIACVLIFVTVLSGIEKIAARKHTTFNQKLINAIKKIKVVFKWNFLLLLFGANLNGILLSSSF